MTTPTESPSNAELCSQCRGRRERAAALRAEAELLERLVAECAEMNRSAS